MEANVEKDCSVLGNLFQTIVSDLRSSSPIWEDFIYKATKLHQSLKTTLVAIGAFLEAFQKVADMATTSKGATREIGSALTRLCMRHKNIEASLKALTSSILDSLVAPLQEKLEDWKKVVAQLDKDHAKEYKKARQEIKKAASDTMRLQKKVKKGVPHGVWSSGKNEMQLKLDVAMQDVNARYQQLEEAEKNSVRTALIEERGRFCLFISCIKPFVDHEVQLLTEVTHLQEIMHCLCMQASEPQSLPPSSEQVILDLKGMDPSAWNIQPSPPSSPSSLGSRKSSMCSINSINSSSSGSSKSHSPSHTMHKRTASQPPMGSERLTSVSSQDSGFTSQDMLFLRPATPQSLSLYQASNSDRDSTGTDTGECDSTPTTPSGNMVTTPTSSVSSTSSHPVAPTAVKQERVRPHTISASSEKAYASRPALKPELFEPLPEKADQGDVDIRDQGQASPGGKIRPHSAAVSGPYARPSATINKMQPVLPPHCPRPKVKAVPPPSLPPGAQPVYANTMDLQRMVVENQARQQQRRSAEDAGGDVVTLSISSAQQNVKPSASAPTDSGLDLSTMDLEAAIRSLDSCTAALINEVVEEDKEKNTEAGGEDEKEEEVETRRASRSQKMQQNSLELAAAIRELEESTAALQSTYDTSSHTSHSSLQCSSGYATMNSTPSSSEDTIASGDFEFPSLAYEAEKYFTIPRSGEMSAAYRAALYPKRPASTAGVPASGVSIMRRSSMNASKPPPPVRRTASISSSSSGGQKGSTSPPRQLEGTATTSVSDEQGDGAYAELQFIQHNIQSQRGHHQKMQPPQQPQMPPPARPKVGALQRQQSNEAYYQQHPPQSSPSPDRVSNSSASSGGSSHYAVPSVATSPGQASLIQSLNAKFASLNQQYQDSQYQQDFPNNSGTYVGGSSSGGGGDADAARMMPPPAAPPPMGTGQPPQVAVHTQGPQGEGYPPPGHSHSLSQRSGQHAVSHGYQQGYPGEGHGHIQSHWPQGHDRPSHGHLQGHPVLGHQMHAGHAHQGHAGQSPFHGHSQDHTGQGHAYGHTGGIHGQQVQQHSEGEDFPLPPTAEELAEMEEMYSRPPPVNPKPSIQVNLMMELKKRVSLEEASDV